MNQKLNKILLNIAVIFMIAELSYINSKSLLHLSGSANAIHQVFAIIGAIAFSIVTIRVMQEEGIRWQKIVFPVFDAILVFLGFNLDLYPNMRIYLTVFMAVFAGLIMYSLGLIEYNNSDSKEDQELAIEKDRCRSLSTEITILQSQLGSLKSDLANKKSEFKEMQSHYSDNESDLNNLQSQLGSVKSDLANKETQLEEMQSYYSKLETDYSNLQTEFEKKQSEIKVMQPVYLKYERSRILKKSEKNRTPGEIKLLENA